MIGNIRVFARVRPALEHESPSPDALADISYGDERLAAETGQGQMIISSKTESATGKERESVNTFAFDKVSHPPHRRTELMYRSSNLLLDRRRSLKRSRCWLRVFLMVTMYVLLSSHMPESRRELIEGMHIRIWSDWIW
jgi:kinesin family protein C1